MATKLDKQIDAINAARKAAQKRAKNPLTRVKPTSPSMATGKAPTKRLVARRKKTERAPKGVYANPSRIKGRAPASGRGRVYDVSTSKDGYRFTLQSRFWAESSAKTYARALAKMDPSLHVLVESHG